MTKKICLILTATIDPKGMIFLKRSNIKDRYNDYLQSFIKWCDNKTIRDIIFIENSGFDLKEFHSIKNMYPEKNIEIISSSINNNFDRNLGKGYGEYLSLSEIFIKSQYINNYNYLIAVSGRHYVRNIKKIYLEVINANKDIIVCLKDNLRFVDTNLYTASIHFFRELLLSHIQKTNDTKGLYFEHCVAKAVLDGINKGYSFSQLSIYPDIYGYIGTNNKLMNFNFIKKFKLYIFGKIKKYFFQHARY